MFIKFLITEFLAYFFRLNPFYNLTQSHFIMNPKSKYLKAIILAMAGTALVCLGIYLSLDKIEFLSKSIEVDGIVERLEETGSGTKSTYYPLVTFTDRSGQSFTFLGSIGSSSSSSYTEGEHVSVRYLEGKPETAKIASFMQMWLIVAIPFVIAIIFLLVGIGDLVKHAHYKKMMQELPRRGKLLKLPNRVESKEVSKSKTNFVIISEWLNPVDNTIYTFKNPWDLYDPTALVKDKEVDVWIDTNNPKKNYYMDLSFLPKKA